MAKKKKKKELTIPLFKFREERIVRVSFRFNCFLSEDSYSAR